MSTLQIKETKKESCLLRAKIIKESFIEEVGMKIQIEKGTKEGKNEEKNVRTERIMNG